LVVVVAAAAPVVPAAAVDFFSNFLQNTPGDFLPGVFFCLFYIQQNYQFQNNFTQPSSATKCGKTIRRSTPQGGTTFRSVRSLYAAQDSPPMAGPAAKRRVNGCPFFAA